MKKGTEASNREKAMDWALYSSRLLAPEYFDSFSNALASKDKEKFMKICKQAQIPDDMASRLFEGLTKGFHLEKAPW